MKIIFDENPIIAIRNSVLKKAKYQKVILLFDDKVGQEMICEIYQSIKDEVVFNKKNISTISQDELNDGYKVIIYCCCVDSYLKFKYDNQESDNIFYPTDENVLPFILRDDTVCKTEDVLIVQSKKLDVKMLSSVYFNLFFSYCNSLLFQQDHKFVFEEFPQKMNVQNVLNCITALDETVQFLDVKVLKQCDLLYEDISIVQIVILNAMISLMSAIKEHNIMLVDVYKAAKSYDALVDKLYAMYFGESFASLVKLNYQHLLMYAEKTKSKILDYVDTLFVSKGLVEEIIEKIKVFAKTDNGLLGYLYLFNIFGT